MTIGEKIKSLRKKQGLTQKQLADILGLSPTAVSAWERDANNPMMDSISFMAKLFDVPISDFFVSMKNDNYQDGSNFIEHLAAFNARQNKQNGQTTLFDTEIAKSNDRFSEIKEQYSYPFINKPISAGLLEYMESVVSKETINIPDIMMGKYAYDKNITMMRVNGESMNKVIPHGSLIAVKKTSIENIKDGDIVVFSYDHDYSVKRIYRSGDKMIFRPDSNDIAYTDTVVTANENLNIVGKVVVYIVELD